MAVTGLGDGDKVGHEEEREEGLDTDRGLWAWNWGAPAGDDRLTYVDVMAAEGCVHKVEKVRSVWSGLLSALFSSAGCRAQVEDESGAASLSAGHLGGESRKR